MVVGINSNLAASSATANLNKSNAVVSDAISRLSSGNRIIKASDDAAGLAIGTSLSTTVTTLEIALLNTEQARSVLSIADGALSQINDILARQKALATQANSGSISDTERGYINQEFTSLTSEIDRIVTNTNFNGITLLNGSIAGGSGTGLAVSSSVSAVTDTGTVGSSALDGSTFTVSTSATSIIGSTSDIVITGQIGAAGDGSDASFSLSLGGRVFTSGEVDVSSASSTRAITFTDNVNGGTIAVSLTTYAASTAQSEVDTIAAAIQADLDELTVYQTRVFDTTSSGIQTTDTAGTILQGLDGAEFELAGTGFDTSGNTAPAFGTFSVTAETQSSDGKISVDIGGVAYETVDGQFDGQADDLNGDDNGGGAGVVRLYRAGDSTTYPNEYLDIDIGAAAEFDTIQIDSEGSAELLSTALNAAVGVGNNGALSFQVGSSVTDKIDISITSAETADLYVNDAGTSTTLSVSSQTNAQTAIDVLDNAIANVVSKRAEIGASISRFDFAASNVEVSISNQDAARGAFLDADIANESTSFATAQVKLQASVSVLAQANQLPQALLQLLQ